MTADWVKVFLALYLIAIVALIGWMMIELPKAKEAELDRKCEQVMRENKWGFLAPPMEKNDVWITRKAAEEN